MTQGRIVSVVGSPWTRVGVAVSTAALMLGLVSAAFGALRFYQGKGTADEKVSVNFELRGHRGVDHPKLIRAGGAQVEDFTASNFRFTCTQPGYDTYYYRDPAEHTYKGVMDVQ